jgi:alpha-glucosidase (family GH31 glycosyl hydrolase)
MQVGAFNPFFRNHNGLYGTPQDPGAFGPAIADSMRRTVEIRYTLLPYLYTLFYNVHTNGGTVVRSLIHEFPYDRRTIDIDEQFLWGSALLISPCITQGRVYVDVYFPPEARWYDYYTGKEINPSVTRVNAPRDFIPLHVRGGYVIPTQDPAENTVKSRQNPFGIIVAPDESGKATGTLYWDDGESLDSVSGGKNTLVEFNFSQNANQSLLSISVKRNGYSFANKLNKIRLLDVKLRPTQILVDSVVQNIPFTFNTLNEELDIQTANLSLNGDHTILFKF